MTRAARTRLAWAVLAAALPWLATAAGAASVEDGQRAFDLGQIKQAWDIWTPLAEAGQAQAAFGLGLLYDIGSGVPENPEKAYHWYARAAAAGLPAAEFNVAVMLDSGRGVAHDAEAAATWYGRAAARGHHRAQYNLGQLYTAGEGVPRNKEMAAAWYREARGGVSAASGKLAALQAQARPSIASDTLLPAVPMAPSAGATTAAQVELVWAAPAQTLPVRYYVELRALDADGSHEVLTRTLDTSATLVDLHGHPGRYAWRVYTVQAGSSHYAVDAWSAFQVE